MANWPFTRGIHELGSDCYGFVQPDGTWGWSNAGLIAAGHESLLIDTLMSVPLTAKMLAEFRARLPSSVRIRRLINTHANPDHFFGNQLLADAEIIATSQTSRDMAAFDPRLLSELPSRYQHMGEGGEFLFETMGRKFDFSGVKVTLPTRTFEKELTLEVGDKVVKCIDVGPAHTASDVLVYLPEEKIVFTGDILFNEGHPIMWAGPIENWIEACRYIRSLDVDVVVPGHGPITDKGAVAKLQEYFEYIRAEARRRFEAGMGFEEAARDINLREYRRWSDSERIVANVFALYRAWGTKPAEGAERELFGAMGRLRRHFEHAHAT